jgi:hypothetical protein
MNIDLLVESGGRLYRTTFPDLGVSFSYRLLTMKEYRVFVKLREGALLPPLLLAEEVFKRCYLGAAALISQELPAGVTVSVGQLVMWLSGDCEQDTLKHDIQIARQMNPPDTVLSHMMAVINMAFSTYSLEDMGLWTRPELIEKFTIAENMLSLQNPEFQRMQLKDIKTPEEMAKMKAKKKSGGVDFGADNAAIKKAMGPHLIEENANRSSTLTKQQVQELSRRRRAL